MILIFFTVFFFKWVRFVPGTLCSRGRFVEGTDCSGTLRGGTDCGGDDMWRDAL